MSKLKWRIVSLFVLLVLALPGVTAAEQLYVNEGGWWRDGGVFDESRAPIQAAVDAANACDTIVVQDGIYSENVNVCERLTIRSENGSASTTVQAANSDAPVFNVTANYVNISGFNVTGATGDGAAGILLVGANHCNISENNASNSFSGIMLFLSSNNKLTNNNANLNGGFGIQLERSSDNILTSNNANSNDREGIHLRESSDNNTLTGNTANSNNFIGIHLLISSYNMLTNSITDSNNEFGIFLENSSYCNIENNTANNNTGFEGETDGPPPSIGILILGSHNIIRQNDASNNFIGIAVLSGGPTEAIVSENNTIEGNTANDNTMERFRGEGLPLCGIMLDGADNNTIINNTANSNDGSGIFLHSSSNNNLTGNMASNNNREGICLGDSSDHNMLSCNTVNSNNVFGISLSFSSNSTVTNNTASHNDYEGIRLQFSHNNTLTGNTASNNNREGIRMGNSDNNTISNNMLSNNNRSGICLDYSCNYNTINSNVVNDNDCGISLLSSSNCNNITCNLVQDNMRNGFYLAGGSIGNGISCNNIVRNGDYNLATDGYKWQFENDQGDCVDAIDNWWGTSDESEIIASIYGGNNTPDRGIVTYLPRLGQPTQCAPAPYKLPAFTTADAVIALRIAAGSSPHDPRLDVSGDKRVTSLDALMILHAAAGSIEIG